MVALQRLPQPGLELSVEIDRLLDIVWTGITSTPCIQAPTAGIVPSVRPAEPMNTKKASMTGNCAPRWASRRRLANPTERQPAAFATPSRRPSATR
jgi:hypothetical protein